MKASCSNGVRLPPAFGRLVASCALLLCSGCLPFIADHPRAVQLVRSGKLDTITPLELKIDEPVDEDPPPQALSAELSDSEPEPTHIESPEQVAGSVPLTLEAARAAALRSNLDLRIEILSPELARQGICAEIGRFESTFRGTVSRRRADLAPGLPLGAPDSHLDNLNAAVDVPLVTGGTVTVDSDASRSAPLLPGFRNTYDTSLGVSVRQPILRGAGVKVNTAPIHVAAAQTGIAASRAKLTAIQVLADVERAFWALYSTREVLKIRQEQVRISAELLRNTLRRIELNAMPAAVNPKAERLRAEFGLRQRRSLLIAAQTDVKLAERELKRVMQRSDLRVEETTEILPVTPPEPVGLHLDRTHMENHAIHNRMEMLELQLQLLIEDLNVEVESNARLPRVDLGFDYRGIGQRSRYTDSVENLLDGEFKDRLFLLTAEVPLHGNISATSRLQQAKIRRVQNLIAQDRVAVLIRKEVNDSVDQIERDWLQIEENRLATEAARETFVAEKTVHLSGRITATQLLDAASNLASAQESEILSLVQYQLSKVDLAVATGTMLGFGQIHWADNACR